MTVCNRMLRTGKTSIPADKNGLESFIAQTLNQVHCCSAELAEIYESLRKARERLAAITEIGR